MHILHLSPFYAPFVGGAQTYLQAINQRLVQDGHEVTVVTSDATSIASVWSSNLSRATPAYERLNGVQVIRCPIVHYAGYPLLFHLARRVMTTLASHSSPKLLHWLGEQVPRMPTLKSVVAELAHKNITWDVVHGINITLESPMLMAEQLAIQKKIPMVSTPFVHVGTPQVMRNYVMPHQLSVLRNSSAVFVQTPREMAALTLLQVNSPKLLLGMGVDPVPLSAISPSAFRQQHGLRPEEPIILFIGTLSYDKGVLHLLEAMQQLWQQGLSAKLVMAGDKPDKQFDKALAQLSPAHQVQVIQVGLVSGLLKQELLAAATLLALPSQVDSFGIVFLEAWLHGKPVIGANAGGIPDVIENGKDGFVGPFGDVQALAQHIQQLIQQPDLAHNLGKQGKKKVFQHFTWDQIYQQWLAGVDKVL